MANLLADRIAVNAGIQTIVAEKWIDPHRDTAARKLRRLAAWLRTLPADDERLGVLALLGDGESTLSIGGDWVDRAVVWFADNPHDGEAAFSTFLSAFVATAVEQKAEEVVQAVMLGADGH